jgi:hypothetical protein
MFLDYYYKERMLYERRLQLLDILDGFARDTFYDEDYSVKEDEPKMITLRKQFADVMNPVNVEDELKRIYPEHLYRPAMKI